MTVRPSPIREALNHRYGVGNGHMWRDALAELDALEAVADAAADVWASQGGPDSMRSMGDALARLVAVQDGQTEGDEGRGKSKEARAGSTSPHTDRVARQLPQCPGGETSSPSVCPCKSHGDPDGDCGERCA